MSIPQSGKPSSTCAVRTIMIVGKDDGWTFQSHTHSHIYSPGFTLLQIGYFSFEKFAHVVTSIVTTKRAVHCKLFPPHAGPPWRNLLSYCSIELRYFSCTNRRSSQIMTYVLRIRGNLFFRHDPPTSTAMDMFLV